MRARTDEEAATQSGDRATHLGDPATRSGDPATRVRVSARVEGTVQGVGFRPFVYRLAHELGIGGFVLNDDRGVLMEAEGEAAQVEELLQRLRSDAPPLAVVERVEVTERRMLIDAGAPAAFEIRPSAHGEAADAPVTPDTATCADCLRELFDPADRRYRYPFTNCTNCGPRFTIVRGIPYDRPFTTMAGFRMCARCQQEYDEPDDRRFHAQPNACPECGPAVALLDPSGASVALGLRLDPVQAAAAALAAGQIVAVKGIGGYHLACRGDCEPGVATLRARKHREDKPFALMAASEQAAERVVDLDRAARELLLSPARPIVLAPRAAGAAVAESVAPHARELGVMLPYSPLHHLLLSDCGAETLVMTSGNLSDEPISFDDAEALERLAPVADLLLVHDRPIQTRTDDSVARVVAVGSEAAAGAEAAARPDAAARRTCFVRRSRGYVPGAIPLPGEGTTRPLLACGAELKNTFCLARGSRAWVSHHIGDLQNLDTLRSFTDGIEHFKRLFAVAPEVVAHDLHPDYLSTKYAMEQDGVELFGVQHHHAHLAACLAEQDVAGAAIGAIFDGTGYGLDGSVWGGEILYGDLGGFRRVGALHPARLPGGEQAIKQPWRMACAWLTEATGSEPDLPASLAGRVDRTMWSQVSRIAQIGLASPLTTSAGRLFDAVAALSGLRAQINYEGQAAIELEAACDPLERGRYPIVVGGEPGTELLVLDPTETIRAIAADVAATTPVAVIAARFHNALAAATITACTRAASECDTELVVLSGGVFLNRRLLEAVGEGLTRAGLRVLTPVRLPAGDGGISFGQAAIAARAGGS
jgi:hydrogenase maturation protein HypF